MKRAVFNQKGGVGKTSITCNLAAAMAKLGRKTLVIDLDSQANTSKYLLGDRMERVQATIVDFFNSTLSFRLFSDSLMDTIYETEYPGLFVIPASDALKELQPKLEGRYKIFKLSEAVDVAREKLGFDEVFFDTPPALNFYSMSAMLAADRVLIPFDCDAFSEDAVQQVMVAVDEIRADHRPELSVEGVVINHFQSQAKLPITTIERLIAKGFPVIEPYLTSSVIMRESHSEGTPLPFYRPGHKLTQEFMTLAQKLIANETGIPAQPHVETKPKKSGGSRKREPTRETESDA
ncbi:MAG: ParA family protein [Bdellovibrionota bacterium]|nr:MAG: ParA family protein [Pseudomonadota bacterium]